MFGIIGSGSWATALAKILTDNNEQINWLVRTDAMADFINKQKHNPNYLTAAIFEPSLLNLDTSVSKIVSASDYIIIATPSAYVVDTLKGLSKRDLEGKKVISAVKGIIPQQNILLNDYLEKEFGVALTDYFTIMGPCHDEEMAAEIATYFKTGYLNTVINDDIYGVQFAAILKNIYALGAGIAHGLQYGDNFLSVLIANSAD